MFKILFACVLLLFSSMADAQNRCSTAATITSSNLIRNIDFAYSDMDKPYAVVARYAMSAGLNIVGGYPNFADVKSPLAFSATGGVIGGGIFIPISGTLSNYFRPNNGSRVLGYRKIVSAFQFGAAGSLLGFDLIRFADSGVSDPWPFTDTTIRRTDFIDTSSLEGLQNASEFNVSSVKTTGDTTITVVVLVEAMIVNPEAYKKLTPAQLTAENNAFREYAGANTGIRIVTMDGLSRSTGQYVFFDDQSTAVSRITSGQVLGCVANIQLNSQFLSTVNPIPPPPKLPCSVNLLGSSRIVLPNLNTADVTAVGSGSQPKSINMNQSFELQLSNCPAGVSPVGVLWDKSSSASGNSNYLQNQITGTSALTGVGVQVLYSSSLNNNAERVIAFAANSNLPINYSGLNSLSTAHKMNLTGRDSVESLRPVYVRNSTSAPKAGSYRGEFTYVMYYP